MVAYSFLPQFVDASMETESLSHRAARDIKTRKRYASMLAAAPKVTR